MEFLNEEELIRSAETTTDSEQLVNMVQPTNYYGKDISFDSSVKILKAISCNKVATEKTVLECIFRLNYVAVNSQNVGIVIQVTNTLGIIVFKQSKFEKVQSECTKVFDNLTKAFLKPTSNLEKLAERRANSKNNTGKSK